MIKGLKPGRVRAAALAAAVAITMTACNQNPYALSVHEINESGPQQPAAIQLSDPQIYARETMLNDRRQEVDFLQEKLRDSKNENFEPQMKRVVQFAESFSGKVTANLNPAQRAQLRRSEAVERLDTDIAIQQRELQRLVLMRQTNEALKNLDQPPSEGQSTQLPPINQTTIDGLNDKIKELEGKIKTLEQAKDAERAKAKPIDLPDTDTPRAADIRATPQERFRDLMAYRNDVRSALASAELDDSHDYSGNSLYRLQFTATVAPGQQKNKYGVARVTIVPPQANTFDYADLYRLWLSHVSYRLNGLNYLDSKTAKQHIDTAYETLAAQRDLFRHVTYDLSSEEVVQDETGQSDKNARFLRVVVPPALYSSARTILDKGDYLEVLKLLKRLTGEVAHIRNAPRKTEVKETPEESTKSGLSVQNIAQYLVRIGEDRKAARQGNSRPWCIETEIAIRLQNLHPVEGDKDADTKRYYRTIFELIDPGPSGSELSGSLAASLRGMGDWSFLNDRAAIDNLVRRVITLQAWSDQLRRLADWDNRDGNVKPQNQNRTSNQATQMASGASSQEKLNPKQEEVSPKREELSDRVNCDEELLKKIVPGVFLEFVGQAHYESGRGAFAYAASPLEMSQRISTVASAITSLELGLNVAAQLQGANLGADLSYLRSARGQADALERLPIVVGFSDRSGSEQTVRFRGDKADDSIYSREIIHRLQDQRRPSAIFEPLRADEVCFPYSVYKRERDKIRQEQERQGQRLPKTAFTDRSIEHCGWTPPLSQFGWVFGPQAALDPKDKALTLQQSLRSYPVVADVSLPSWWPYATFVFETAWIANWHGGSGASAIINADDKDFVTRRTFHRPLPRNRADLDGLTEALAHKTLGGSLATTRVMRIEPERIQYCADDVMLLAYGTNVWRGTEAYLNGVKEKSLRVLPDMSGLAITFEASKLQSREDGDRLVIWTRNGPAQHELSIRKSENCVAKALPAAPPGTAEVVPPYILGDTQKVVLKLTPVPANVESANLHFLAPDWSPVSLVSSKKAILPNRTVALDFSDQISEALPNLKTTLIGMKAVIAVRSGSVPTEYAFAKPVVYYPTADDAKATFAGPSKGMDKPTAPITIKLPQHADVAYPALKTLNAARIAITVKGEDKFKPQASGIKIDKGNLTFTLSFPAGQTAEFAKAERTMNIKFAEDLGLPALVCSDCLKFKPLATPTPADQKKE